MASTTVNDLHRDIVNALDNAVYGDNSTDLHNVFFAPGWEVGRKRMGYFLDNQDEIWEEINARH